MKPLVMITGASTGIGAAMADAYSAAGHPLLLIARDANRIAPLPRSLAVAADVRDYAALAEALTQAETNFGPVDCLIANAGISRLARFDEQEPSEWRDLIDINCLGVLNSAHVVAPGMKERRHGTIITISSIAGRKVYPHHDVYGGTKHFVHAITEGLRQTMSHYNVRVMVMAPGVAKSEIEKTITHKSAYEFWNAGREKLDGGLDVEVLAQLAVFAYGLPQAANLQEMTITHTGQEY